MRGAAGEWGGAQRLTAHPVELPTTEEEEQEGFFSDSDAESEAATETKDIAHWGGGEVAAWLATLGPPCSTYQAAFTEHVRGWFFFA